MDQQEEQDRVNKLDNNKHTEESIQPWKKVSQNISQEQKKESIYIKATKNTKNILEQEQKLAAYNKEYYEKHKDDPIPSVFLENWTQEQQDSLFGQDIHLFFIERKNAVDTNVVFYKNKKDFYAEHMYGNVMKDDRDPSINTATARLCYQRIKQVDIKDHVDYTNIQYDEDNLDDWLDLMEMMTKVEMLRVIQTGKKKIYFVDVATVPECFDKHKEFQKYKVPTNLLHKDTNVDEKTRNIFKEFDLANYIHDNINATKIAYCAIVTENIKSWRYLYENMYMGAWQSENERWDIFYVCEGEYPDDEKLQYYQGIVCSGSHDHAYNLFLPWIPRYHQWLRNLYTNTINLPRMVTICFSHQSTAHSMNGKAAKRKGKMVNRYEQLNFTDDFFALDWVQNSRYLDKFKNEKVYGFETHGDHVEKLPKDGKVVMTSAYTPINGYFTGKTISMQFHTEINYTVMYKTFQDLIQTKNEATEVLKEFDETYEDSNKQESRFWIQELIMQWLKKPWERKDAKEQERLIAQKAKKDRKTGFLWDIIYELGFMEVEKKRQSLTQGSKQHLMAKKISKKMTNTSPTKKRIQKINDKSTKKPDGNESTEKQDSQSESESDTTEELISNISQQFRQLPKVDNKERIKQAKQHYKHIPRPILSVKQQVQPVSRYYQEYYEKLNNYLSVNKQELDKIMIKNQVMELQQSFWIAKKILDVDQFIIYENSSAPSHFFEGIANQRKFINKIENHFKNKQKSQQITFDQLIQYIEEWFKTDENLIVQYDKKTKFNAQQPLAGKKYTKNEIRDQYKQNIEQFERMLQHCELPEDQKILKRTVDHMKQQIEKLSTQAQTITRKDNMKIIYQYYADKSICQEGNQGVDQENFIQFLKDFKLWGIFINFPQFIQIFNNNAESYNALQWEEFMESVNSVAQIILPDQSLSSDEKLEKFYEFLNIDDPQKMQAFRKQSNQQQVKQNRSLVEKSNGQNSNTNSSMFSSRMSPISGNRKIKTYQTISNTNRSLSPRYGQRTKSPIGQNIFNRANELAKQEQYQQQNHITMRK